MNLSEMEKDELLPWLANNHDCRYGIEIGVRDGSNLRRLLQHTSMMMYAIDIVRFPQIAEIEHEFGPRCYFIQRSSIEAAECMGDGSLDFIYIDADHRYESVKADLDAWYPKLNKHGVFCGDDYCDVLNPTEGQYGIVQAIEEFIADKDVKLHISGLGIVDKDFRLDYAHRIGKLHEDNLFLGLVGHVPIDPKLLIGRVRTEGVPVPQWWFIK